jgi:hypothetical protein
MEATRLAPAGRACSKFIWQKSLPKNWAVRSLPRSGRPRFLSFRNTALCASPAEVGQYPDTFDGSSARALTRRSRHAIGIVSTSAGWRRRTVATFSPRLGVTCGARNVAGRRGLAETLSLRELGGVGMCSPSYARPGTVLANSKPSRVNSAQQASWLGNVLPPRWASAFRTRNLLLCATE